MLEGVCEIELRDKDGNIVKRTKDKNMVTNGFLKYLNPNDALIIALAYKSYIINNIERMNPILRKLVGGVYLFNTIQNETADNLFPVPHDLVGCASLSKENSIDTRIGLWNITESAVLYDESMNIKGIKFVWDFPTDKGNGTIRSVSLTSDVGARYAFNNRLGNIYINDSNYLGTNIPFNLIDPVSEILSPGQSSNGEFDKTPSSSTRIDKSFLGSIGNELIVLTNADYNSKTITLKKFRIKTSIKLNEFICDSDYTQRWELIKTAVIDVSDCPHRYQPYNPDGKGNEVMACEFSNSAYIYEGYIYIGVAKSDKIYLKKIDINLDVVETVNRTFEGNNLNNIENNKSRAYTPLYIYKDYYVVRQNTAIIFINRTDMTVQKNIDIGNDQFVFFGYYKGMLFINCSSGGLYYVNQNLDVVKSSKTPFVINGAVPLEINGIDYPYIALKQYTTENIESSSSRDYLYTCRSINIFITGATKFTIDNLQSPVTKTASQTMKVIYTIQDSTE